MKTNRDGVAVVIVSKKCNACPFEMNDWDLMCCLQMYEAESAAAEIRRRKDEEEIARKRAIRLSKRRGFCVDAPTRNAAGEEVFCLCNQTDTGGYVECLGTTCSVCMYVCAHVHLCVHVSVSLGNLRIYICCGV